MPWLTEQHVLLLALAVTTTLTAFMTGLLVASRTYNPQLRGRDPPSPRKHTGRSRAKKYQQSPRSYHGPAPSRRRETSAQGAAR
jgi:hypothetical protein